MRANSDEGISLKKVDGNWTLILKRVLIYNADVTHQKSVVLDGKLVCTDPVE